MLIISPAYFSIWKLIIKLINNTPYATEQLNPCKRHNQRTPVASSEPACGNRRSHMPQLRADSAK